MFSRYKEGERSFHPETKAQRTLRFLSPRRRLRLLSSGALLSGVLLIACTEQPSVWIDPSLKDQPDRGLTSLMMRYDPHRAGGSVRMETCYNSNGQFRIVSYELAPRPGYLVDQTFLREGIHDGEKCYRETWPVAPIDQGDEMKVYLGLGQNDDELSTAVRTYQVSRTGPQTLKVAFVGNEDLGKPKTLPMRDAPVKRA